MSEENRPVETAEAIETQETTETNQKEAQPKRPVEFLVGRLIVALVIVGVGASFTVAMFYSIYKAVSKPPQVWAAVPGNPGKKRLLKPSTVRQCVLRLRKLDKELEHESTSLWHRLRTGNRLYLSSWKDWAQDWKRRMQLLQRQCPIRGEKKLPRAFQRASRRLLVLHQRQVVVFEQFYKKNAWLFQEIRQGMRTLKEDIP